MKNKILKYFIILLSLSVIFIVYISTVGVETDKFNNQIKNRISQLNKNIDMDLKKISDIMSHPIIIDFRNLFSLDSMKKFNIEYHSIGRETINSNKEVKWKLLKQLFKY